MTQPKELLTYGNPPFPEDRILVIDIAGAPHRVNKISLCTLDQSFQYEADFTDRIISPDHRANIQDALYSALMIVGHGLNSQTKALKIDGFSLCRDTFCADTYYTIRRLEALGEIPEGGIRRHNVRGCLSFFGFDSRLYHHGTPDARFIAALFLDLTLYKAGRIQCIRPDIRRIEKSAEISNGKGEFL